MGNFINEDKNGLAFDQLGSTDDSNTNTMNIQIFSIKFKNGLLVFTLQRK